MREIVVEQALFHREYERPPELTARSPGFREAWDAEVRQLIDGFGERSGGVSCPSAVFARPLDKKFVAVVHAKDQDAGPSGWPALRFHVAVLARGDYEAFLADPFEIADRLPQVAEGRKELPTLQWTATPLAPRTVTAVQAILMRVKAGALRDDEDPEAVMERTVENSESPALLGGAQVLVDGGKLVFIRGRPDNDLVRGLWTLLPHSLRASLWPASFVFSNDLQFDIVVAPRFGDGSWAGYTTEEQAATYPAGSYELALQTAAEAGDQTALDAVFVRRTSNETLRLAVHIVVLMGLFVLAMRFLLPTPQHFPHERRAALSAGIVAIGNPWTALTMMDLGNRLAKRDEGAK